MRPVLDDAAAVEDEDAVEGPHRRQPVSDDDGGAPAHQPRHGLLHQRLRFRIQAGCRLVEDQDRRVRQEGAGQRHPLALAARQLDAALAHRRGVALRQPRDEVVRVGEARRPLDLPGRGAGPGVGDVLGQGAVEQHRFLGHDSDLRPQARLARRRHVLSVDRHAPARHVVEPLDQLDEGRLAGARAPHQSDPLAGRNRDGQPVVEGPRVVAVVEAHGLEADRPARDREWNRAGAVRDADGFGLQGDQLLHLVDGPLQVVDVAADVAEVAVHHEGRGQDVGDVARARPLPPPQPQGDGDDDGAQDEQQPELAGAAPGDDHPRAPGPPLPLPQQPAEPRLLPRLRAEGLDDGVVADRVAQRAAEAGVEGVRQGGRGRDDAGREEDGRADIGARADRDRRAEGRPVQAEHEGRAHQDDERGQERQQQRVVEPVDRPHAAGDLPDGRAREGVGVPLGREALDAGEAVADDIAHGVQGERHHQAPGDVPQQHGGEAEPGHRQEGRPGRVQRGAALAPGERVDQAARVERQQHFRQGGERDRAGETRDEGPARAPAADDEGQDATDRVRLPG